MSEPQHPALWDEWKAASAAYEECHCGVCLGDHPEIAGSECEAWIALTTAKRRYLDAKESYL